MSEVEENVPQGFAVLIQICVCIAVLIGGFFVANSIFGKAEMPERKTKPRQARLVQVEELATRDYQIQIKAMGTVTAAKQSALQMDVNGTVTEVVEVLVPGNVVKKGQALIRVDDQRYRRAVEQRRADLADAKRDYIIQQGDSAVAKREFELTGVEIKDEERDLVLRLPQLEAAKAAVSAAESALAEAIADLDKCTLRVPFDAIVLSKQCDVGEQISGNKTVAELLGSEEFWIEALVSERDLQWIQQGAGSALVKHPSVWSDGQSKQAQLLQVLPQLEDAGRMARVLLSVPDPLAEPKLLLGAFVSIDLKGPSLKDQIIVPNELIQEGAYVWIVENDTLKKKTVDVLWSNKNESVIKSGLSAGQTLVTSRLASVTDGMPVRIHGAAQHD